MRVVAHRALGRVGVGDANFVDLQARVGEDRGEAELEIGRLERGVALDQRERADQVLGDHLCGTALDLVSFDKMYQLAILK